MLFTWRMIFIMELELAGQSHNCLVSVKRYRPILVSSCLANDTGYENVYSRQLKVKANPGDLLIVLSGSGNSPNVVNALVTARELGMRSSAIVAFRGGRCKELADQAIHFPINDMQIAEDTQLIIGHLCMQWLNTHKPQNLQSKPNA